MPKSKKLLILSLSVLILIAVVVIVVLQSGMLSTSFRFFSKPIDNVDDIKNAPEIVEMTETAPEKSTADNFNRYIAESGDPWPFTNGALCYELKYKSDEYIVQGFLAMPDDYLEKEYPVLIYNRGGHNTNTNNEGFIDIDSLYSLSRMGFIVLATQYRNWDWGLSEESGKDEMGGGDVRDVTALIDLAEKFTFTNKKIYMFGGSRGATEAYIVLSRDNRINAAVAIAGPTDLIKAYNEREDMMPVLTKMIGGTPEEVPEEYKKRSAIYWADKINTPLLIAHGTEDKNVLVHHSVDLYDKMKALGKDVELRIHEGEDHYMPHANHMRSYLEWLLEH